MPAQPHILLICTDEQAPQLMGCMDDPLARTPNLDRLAARGVNFRQAYCNNPICVPGRYSIMTGKYVRELGALYYGDGLDPQTWTYPKHFARAGYQTTCVGKMHFMGLEQMHGWSLRPYGDMEIDRRFAKMPGFTGDPYAESCRDLPNRPPGGGLAQWVKSAGPGENGFILFDDSVTREARIHLRDYFRNEIIPQFHPERPLLFEVSYKTPHWPFWAPRELYDYYRERVEMPAVAEAAATIPFLANKQRNELPTPVTREEILNARAAYYGLIEYVDRQIGQVLDVLDELGVLDDFLILMHTDHGEMAGEHGMWGKACAYEHSVRVPLMVSWPGRIPEQTVVDTPVSNVDIFPTLCDYAGLDTPPDLRGTSLRPLIENPDAFAARTVVSEFFGAGNWVMARRGALKLVRYCDPENEPQGAQLFDLERDPHELDNRIDDPAYAETVRELSREIASLPAPFRRDSERERAWHTPPAYRDD